MTGWCLPLLHLDWNKSHYARWFSSTTARKIPDQVCPSLARFVGAVMCCCVQSCWIPVVCLLYLSPPRAVLCHALCFIQGSIYRCRFLLEGKTFR
eukprot:jgi/Botrbrau1/13892/Bobra.0056s0121.1